MVSVCGRRIGDCVTAAGFQSGLRLCSVQRWCLHSQETGATGAGPALVNHKKKQDTLQVQGSNICFGFDICVQVFLKAKL